MKLVVTIDVEEEGLFRGHYHPGQASANNVSQLALLDPIFRDLGIHPTLFVSYQVACYKPHHDLILQLNEKWGGEIGAHLHPWNTPPVESLPYAEPVPSEMMSRELLEAKLMTLLDVLNRMGADPVSFRMGRFNMGPKMFSVLEGTKIQVDSSIAPTRRQYGGPDHLSAPTDPYFPDPENPCSPGRSQILEVPITILPLTPRFGSFLERLGDTHMIPRSWISWFAQHLGSLPVQPMWTGLRRLKAAANLHRIRGGKIVTIFFHSSELMPQGCPQHPSEGHIERFLEKLGSFLSWVHTEMGVESLTLSDLSDLYRKAIPSSGSNNRHGTA